jgi:pimeloyl-ACP methyl ester carboxylesterase
MIWPTRNLNPVLGRAARNIGYLSLITSPLLAAPKDVAAQSRRFQLPTGVTLNVVEAGRAGAPVVILLHGFADSWQVWESVIPRLAEDHHVYAFDQRGHGDSDKPACCYTQADYVADVVAFMDANDIRRAMLVGHSLGSFVAQNFALEHPDRLARMVLIGSTAACDNAACAELRTLAMTVPDQPELSTVREFQLASFHGPPDPDTFESIMAQSMKVPGRVWRQALPAAIDDDRVARLPDVRVPTLLISGDRDAFFPPAEQRRLLRLIPNARLELYEDVGHFLPVEDPIRLASDLISFLDPVADGAAR